MSNSCQQQIKTYWQRHNGPTRNWLRSTEQLKRWKGEVWRPEFMTYFTFPSHKLHSGTLAQWRVHRLVATWINNKVQHHIISIDISKMGLALFIVSGFSCSMKITKTWQIWLNYEEALVDIKWKKTWLMAQRSWKLGCCLKCRSKVREE